VTQRVCFQLQVRPERIAEYRGRHAAVWPDMLAALAEAGWRNYSLFLSDSGMVIGYLECEDFEAARRAMERTEVNASWQAEMGEFFQGLEGRRPDEGLLRLDEIFHLD
jgi:L-rhamnose mutarotase